MQKTTVIPQRKTHQAKTQTDTFRIDFRLKLFSSSEDIIMLYHFKIKFWVLAKAQHR